jgi:hypothetical protein
MKDGKLAVQPNDYQLLQKDSLLCGISYMPDITSKFRTFAILVITNLQTILYTYVCAGPAYEPFPQKVRRAQLQWSFSYRPQTETKIKFSHDGHYLPHFTSGALTSTRYRGQECMELHLHRT